MQNLAKIRNLFFFNFAHVETYDEVCRPAEPGLGIKN